MKIRFRPIVQALVLYFGLFFQPIWTSETTLRAPRFLSEPTGSQSVVSVNQTKILQCQVIGNPQPTNHWLKDWKPLEGIINEHFLRIPKVSIQDDGEYRCVASNPTGTVISPRIVVKVAHMSPIEFENDSTTGEKVLKVRAGESAILSLPNVASFPLPSVTWRSEEVDMLYDFHYVVADTSNDLIILDSRPIDAQSYSATITNTHLGQEIVTPPIRLEVREENVPEFISPSFVLAPSNATLLKGTSIAQLQCIANARPLLELETLWYKDGDPIERSGVKYFFKHPWNRTLSLLDVGVDHVGEYQCRVRLKSTLDQPLIGTAYVSVQVPPFMKALLPDITEGDLGKKLSISCSATGIPAPTVKWFRNGVALDGINEHRYTAFSNGTFVVSSIELNDTGVLQCLASNDIGEISSYTWLRVKTTAPVLTTVPANISAVDGQPNVVVPCRVTGAPMPNVTWFFKDEPIGLLNGMEISAEGDLIFCRIRGDMSGKYTCRRANKAGQVELSTWIQVLVKTMITDPPVDTSVTLGHVAILQCQYSSADSVSVEVLWFHEGNRVFPSSQVTVREDGSLIIEQVRATDAGTYKCQIVSSGGNDTRSAHLKVMDLPYAPKLITAERETSVPKTARVSWAKNFDGNSPITKFIIFKRIAPSSGVEADLGLNWEIALSNVSSSSSSALVSELRPSTGYQFKVAAVNDVGQGPPSEPSDILILPQEAPSGPPRDLVGSPRSNSEIIIQWDNPIEDEVNGVLKGYIVRYKLWGYKNSQWYLRNVTRASQHNYLIAGLITWKDYEIQVAAYNAKGVGVFTDGIRVKTKEGIPLAPPRDVAVEAMSSTSIEVRWRPPLPWMINGINQGYKVQAWLDWPIREDSSQPITVSVAPSPYPDAEERTEVSGLEEFTTYHVTVLCFTHPGDGNRSIPITVTTLEDVPGKISELSFDEVSDRSLVVTWSPPARHNGVLKGYTLSYFQVDSSLDERHRYDPVVRNLTADVTRQVIHNLTASTVYTFEVFAWTSVGPGERVSATVQSSVEPVPPDPPTRLAVSNIQPFSVVLQFTPGFDGNASIDLWRVQARSWRSSSWEVVQEATAPEAMTLTVGNLIPFTKYSLRLVAVNVAGASSPSLPSPSFQTLQAQPSHAPSNMTLRAMSPTEIRVRWIPLQQHEWYGAARGYLIKYREVDCKCPFRESLVSDVTANSYQLELLQEFTNHEVKMSAVNDVGQSDFTDVAVEWTRESVATAGPSNVTAEATSSTTIVVRWDAVPKVEQNGILEGYKVVYAGRHMMPEEKVIGNNATFSTTLTQLNKFYQYTVQVKAYSRLGDGTLSTPPLLIQTLEDVPGPPSDVSFPDVSFTFARIIWDEPLEPNGVITAYDVTYHLADDSTRNRTVELGPSTRTHRFEELFPESNYMFVVRAKTRLGWGRPLRAPVYTTSDRNLPKPPSKPTVSRSQITSSSILFSWKPGEDGFAPIRYYSVQYLEDGGVWQGVEDRIEYSATSYAVKGLRPFTSYQFRVKATNDIGSSGWSESSLAATTKPAAPTHPPTEVKVIPITRSSVRVEWVPLFPDAWSGDLETGGYRVRFQRVTDAVVATFGSAQMKDLANVTARSVVLDQLQRDANYEVVVTSFNDQGESPPSSPLTVYVGEAVPTGTPENVTATPISSTEIRIHWQPPEEQQRNGELLGYKIFYKKTSAPPQRRSAVGRPSSGSAEVEEVEVVGPRTTSFELLYLDVFTEYAITLLCFNPAGEGPRSTPVTVRTKQSLPGPVIDLRFSDITMNSLKVIWGPPARPNGIIVGYLVTYETAKSYENFSKQVKQKVTTPFLLVQSLKEEVTYKFTVKAETVGYGPEVESNVTTGPQPGSPARPKDVRMSQTVSSVTLHWRNSHPGRSPLIGYYIEAKRKNGDEWTVLMKTDTGSLEEYTVSFQNLHPSTTYNFRLIAYNLFGISYPAVADQIIVTPTRVALEYGYLQQQPFYHSTWFMVSLASASVVVIVVVVAALCVKSKTYKYKQDAATKTLEESLGHDDDGIFPSYEMSTSTSRGLVGNGRGTLNRSTLGRRSVGGATAIVPSKAPPRPAPASVTYHSDDDTVKGYDHDDGDSSDVTEKPTDISSTDSHASESDPEDDDITAPSDAADVSFVSHYANVNETLRGSWRRQRPLRRAHTTDSEAEGSAVVSLNGGRIVINNMAGSRAPLPGFSSFV